MKRFIFDHASLSRTDDDFSHQGKEIPKNVRLVM
jgi:hypothetical protein